MLGRIPDSANVKTPNCNENVRQTGKDFLSVGTKHPLTIKHANQNRSFRHLSLGDKSSQQKSDEPEHSRQLYSHTGSTCIKEMRGEPFTTEMFVHKIIYTVFMKSALWIKNKCEREMR